MAFAIFFNAVKLWMFISVENLIYIFFKTLVANNRAPEIVFRIKRILG